jgi:hypothetical protein
MCRTFRESDPWIDDDGVARDAAAQSILDRGAKLSRHLARRVLVHRVPIHVAWRATVVHQYDGRARFRDRRGQLRICTKRMHVIHDRGASRQRLAGDD